MNKQLYQNNLFLQKTKEKFNPDVLKKKNEFDKNRKINIFKKSGVTYNSITNNTPNTIKTQKDLELPKDDVISDLECVILKKKKERDDQETLLKQHKQPKQKLIVPDKIDDEPTEFIELKSEQNKYLDSHKKTIETNKNRYDDIMNDLKNLGIIN
jgi:hypothetical protein